MEDLERLDLFWAREESALRAGGEKYGSRLLALANRLLDSPQDAEECVSDTWLRAWNAIPPERPEHLFAYLAAICRNLALNRLDWNNARKRKAEVVSLTAELESCIPDRHGGWEMDRQDLGQLLQDFLGTLPEQQRRVFLRRYWYADTVREIARRYGYSESKVKTMLLRTRRRLRDYLEKEGIPV